MTAVSEFQKNNYVYLKDFLDITNCGELTHELNRLVNEGETHQDEQCSKSEAIYGSPIFDSLLEQLLPYFQDVTGKNLYPTYSYARLYKPGEHLHIHSDRPACEISATITLGFEGKPWPIYMADYCDENEGEEVTLKDDTKKFIKNKSKIIMQLGDAVVYRGMEKVHWREEYIEGKWQAQVFLHYVDADGVYSDEKYDRRPNLTNKIVLDNNTTSTDFRYWTYTDILTPEDCDKIIKTYTENSLEKIDAKIGMGLKGILDKDIRNVSKIQLPAYKDIGGRLAIAGFDANFQSWKFNVTHANQSEFLIYSSGGRYKPHIDTFIDPNQKECRKITVLAFLNDDFEGGKFFLQEGHKKTYPYQVKGTIIAFPSWILHGVEDVISGTRYSVVTWLVGPWFT